MARAGIDGFRGPGKNRRAQATYAAETHAYGGPLAQDSAALHQRFLRVHRMGAGTVTTAAAKQIVGALGRTDGGRLPRRHRPCAGQAPAPILHPEEAWPASAPA